MKGLRLFTGQRQSCSQRHVTSPTSTSTCGLCNHPLRSVATEAIEVPNNLGELMVDLQEDLRTHTKALERLNSLVKHMLDTQNHILHVFCFQLDEQYWLELVDPTSPYPFTLRLAPSPRSLQQTKSPTVLLGCISCCIP